MLEASNWSAVTDGRLGAGCARTLEIPKAALATTTSTTTTATTEPGKRRTRVTLLF
jgi:hypothetical protein